MNRRQFFHRAGESAAVALAVAPLIGVPFLTADNYLATGYLGAESPGAHRVDYVTLNGQRLDHVMELNDVEGWLRHYASLEIRSAAGPDVIYRTGVVRVFYRPEEAI